MFCRVCGARVRALSGEGYCWSDFLADPSASPCIVRPELCEAHLGRGRDVAWERAQHDRPHVVYLADSGGLKVGVTTADYTTTRWIDLGARAALRIAETPHRRAADEIEVALKAVVSDKTAWQRMLSGRTPPVDLRTERERIVAAIPAAHVAWVLADEAPTTLDYPLLAQPAKLKSVNLSDVPNVRRRLVGVRGQYLLFEEGLVFNVRRHTGYEVILRA